LHAVHLAFLLLSPAAGDHLQLQILAALARALRDDEVRRRLIEPSSEKELWNTLDEVLRNQEISRAKSDQLRSSGAP
jgi:mannitol/fructose-specific phosphotransferase system IIA component (Ntr-type)